MAAEYRKEGIVSVWVGRFKDESRLHQFLYLDYRYSPPRSQFRKYCALGRYEDDFREAALFPEFAELRGQSFKDFSYANSYLPQLITEMEQVGYAEWNAVIMLYDFSYAGKYLAVDLGNDEHLRFVAALPYQR